ncbi:MAG: recombinase family protein [Bdellovibrionaceae bacterium]|nr:recombinase family protein [Pseudobdellovibrionaceae bacterium]
MNKRVVLYARCSTTRDQNPEVQLAELKRFCMSRGWTVVEEIVDHGFSGTNADRPGLKKLLKLARERQIDVVAVLKLDRLFRSLKHLIITVEEFEELNIEFVSVKDQLDLTTSAGRLLRNLLACFAEFEAALIRERTLIGLDHAVAVGKKLGRPQTKDIRAIQELRAEGLSYRKIAKSLNCSMGAVCRALNSAPKSGSKSTQNSLVKTGHKKP